MITPRAQRCRGPVSRRSFLEMGALTLGGLGMSDFFRLRAMAKEAGQRAPDTSVIFVWLPGGPPHMETYDIKPDAPAEYRGIFKPIKTNVPGIEVCELLPRHAKCADKYTIIRSVSHEFADHGGGHKRFLTGYPPKEPAGFVNDNPMAGSVVSKMREHIKLGLPNYIAEVDGGRQGVDVFSFGSAYLGSATTPFFVVGDPSAEGFKVENLGIAPEMADRLNDRARLLGGMDRLRHDVDRTGLMDTMDKFSRQAMELLTSDRARVAFDLSREPQKLRERYGNHRFGQRALMARRLVEAGASFVTVVMENPGGTMPKNCTYNWDSHAVNCHLFDDAHWRFPYYDQAVTALVEDLYARGLDKKVLLVVTGEFGRTPRLSTVVGSQTGVMQPGRDHWPGAMSMLVAGGGMRTGQIVGATNSKGEHPIERPLKPEDLWATVYRHLGIDWTQSFPDHSGRPMPILPGGEPITEILPAGA
ncbi:MAG: DUF1501 domain-containing protein [Verrucomicrobia bacterium]|nr:DUF1501 domain-containing protein [Verrucomicrobiota bacterium]